MQSLYTAEGTVDKASLWKEHISLVRREALRMRVRVPSTVELDDLIQAGGLGLLSAVEHFDPQLGVPFAGFAVQRIRFAMIDELRSRDWVPRSVRRNGREITNALRQLEQELGRNATEAEIAARLEITVEMYRQRLQESNDSQLFSYEEFHESGDAVEMLTEAHQQQDPFYAVLDDEMRDQVIAGLESLPEREKLVFTLYYQEDLNLSEIGAVMGVGESRISQLHSQAIKRLQARLGVKSQKPAGRKSTKKKAADNCSLAAES